LSWGINLDYFKIPEIYSIVGSKPEPRKCSHSHVTAFGEGKRGVERTKGR